jgi:hypothetical protein
MPANAHLYGRALQPEVDAALLKAIRTAGSGSGGAAWVQGGNSFGALGVLGTNDANPVSVRANATEQIRILQGTGALSNALQIDGDIADINGAKWIQQVATATAVNFLQITNAATTGSVVVAATGTDPTVPLVLRSKGATLVQVRPGADSTTAFGVTNAAGTAILTINSTTAGALLAGNLTQNGGAFSLTGNATSQLSTTGVGSALNITANASSTWSTAVGGLTITSAAAATWSTAVGALTVDAAAALQLGTVNATSVAIGNVTNTTLLSISGTAAIVANSATAGANGDVPAQVVQYLVVTINGTSRKIPFYAT